MADKPAAGSSHDPEAVLAPPSDEYVYMALLVDDQAMVGETVRRMLKENGAPPSGKWADLAVLEPVRDYKARHASTLLTFDAVVDAINQIEAKRRTRVAAE